MVDLIVGTIGGRPLRVIVPNRWNGKVILEALVRDGEPIHILTVKEPAVTSGPAPDQVVK